MNKMRVYTIAILRGQRKSRNQIDKETGVVCSTERIICSKKQQCGSVENHLSCDRSPKLRTRDVRKLK